MSACLSLYLSGLPVCLSDTCLPFYSTLIDIQLTLGLRRADKDIEDKHRRVDMWKERRERERQVVQERTREKEK